MRAARQRPYLLVGWLRFVGALLPVIGLVQVGGQAMADRYTYLPLIGVFIAIAYAGSDLAQRFRLAKWQRALLPLTALALFALATWVQLSRWRDSQTLFAHTVRVTKENAIAHINLGVALEEAGRTNQALTHYREALRINPQRPAAHNN